MLGPQRPLELVVFSVPKALGEMIGVELATELGDAVELFVTVVVAAILAVGDVASTLVFETVDALEVEDGTGVAVACVLDLILLELTLLELIIGFCGTSAIN